MQPARRLRTFFTFKLVLVGYKIEIFGSKILFSVWSVRKIRCGLIKTFFAVHVLDTAESKLLLIFLKNVAQNEDGAAIR